MSDWSEALATRLGRVGDGGGLRGVWGVTHRFLQLPRQVVSDTATRTSRSAQAAGCAGAERVPPDYFVHGGGRSIAPRCSREGARRLACVVNTLAALLGNPRFADDHANADTDPDDLADFISAFFNPPAGC